MNIDNKLSQLPIQEPVSGVQPHNSQEMIESWLPQFDDDRKAAFLSYRATGFSLSESYKLAGISLVILEKWQQTDPMFVSEYSKLLEGTPRLRALRYIELEFIRNFRLMLVKDAQIITKALDPDSELTKQEADYLKTARQHYTPSSLQSLRGLLNGQSGQGAMSFTQFVLNMGQQPSDKPKLELNTGIIEGEKLS